MFHRANVRPKDPAEYETGNWLYRHSFRLIKKAGNKAPVMLASSIQAALDNPYGTSKSRKTGSLTTARENNVKTRLPVPQRVRQMVPAQQQQRWGHLLPPSRSGQPIQVNDPGGDAASRLHRRCRRRADRRPVAENTGRKRTSQSLQRRCHQRRENQ